MKENIEKLFNLMTDKDNPIWLWLPDNAAMLQFAKYLDDNGVRVDTCGEWIDDHGSEVCSVCGFSCNDSYYLGSANYCPECGAKMRKV